MYLLFYSKKCKYSKKFVQILSNIGEEKFFKMVEVSKVNGKFPPIVKKYGITEVPTIFVDGQLFVGPKAFKWLEGKIQNVNHQVSSQNTRMNKTPVISGYIPETNSFSLGGEENIEGSLSFSMLNTMQKIETPDAGSDYQKSSFILANDQITGGIQEIKEDRLDRKSKIDSDLEQLLQERENDLKKKYY